VVHRVRAPSTLGTFLRTLTFGHVRQLDAVASRLLINLAGQAPLLPGADELAYVDVDDTLRQTNGYAKQGAGRGLHRRQRPERAAGDRVDTGVSVGDRRRLNAQGLDELRPRRRPVRHRRPHHCEEGRCERGAGLRADSAYYGHDVIAAALRQSARFFVTARQDKAFRAAIATVHQTPGRLDGDQVHQRGLGSAAASDDAGCAGQGVLT